MRNMDGFDAYAKEVAQACRRQTSGRYISGGYTGGWQLHVRQW